MPNKKGRWDFILGGQFREVVLENGTYKIVALFVTLSLWVFIFERHEDTMSKTLHLEYLLMDGHMVSNEVANEVQFRVRGPRMALKRFLENSDSINVDLTNMGVGRTVVRIYDDILQVPSGIEVVSVSPSSIFVEIERSARKEVPIEVILDSDQYVVIKDSVRPTYISVQGSTESLNQLESIKTLTVPFEDEVEPCVEKKTFPEQPKIKGILTIEPKEISFRACRVNN